MGGGCAPIAWFIDRQTDRPTDEYKVDQLEEWFILLLNEPNSFNTMMIYSWLLEIHLS